MCGTVTAVGSALTGAASSVIGSVLGIGGKPSAPDTGAIQAQAKEAAKAETAAASAKAAQDASAKLASRNRARAVSLLSTGAPSDSAMSTTVGSKTTLGQ